MLLCYILYLKKIIWAVSVSKDKNWNKNVSEISFQKYVIFSPVITE